MTEINVKFHFHIDLHVLAYFMEVGGITPFQRDESVKPYVLYRRCLNNLNLCGRKFK